MKLLSLKLTHDGSFSVFHNHRLELCYEFEKFENNNRFKILNNLEDLTNLLSLSGNDLKNFDKIVIDGWIGLEKSLIPMEGLNKYNLPFTQIRDKEFFDGSVGVHYIFNKLVVKYGLKDFNAIRDYWLSEVVQEEENGINSFKSYYPSKDGDR